MRNLNKLLLGALLILSTWLKSNATSASDDPTNQSHSRKKRLIWITTDGRLALPPGTRLTITPSLSLPFVRYPPNGFLSNMSISLPFTIDFDALGLTDNQNPFGAFPPLLARSMGRQAGSVLADYVAQLMGGRRSTRSVPNLPKPIHSYFQGGERALLYSVVEDLLANFGMDGKACLLRAICEVHGHQAIHKFGFIGEFLQLFLTASRSSYADLMEDYVTAESVGKNSKECYPYFKECPKSLFTNNHNYSKNEEWSPDEETAETVDADVDDDQANKITEDQNDSKSGSSKVTLAPEPMAM
ncbi:uncharacterized protein LOC126905816 [Daktulosphaira vitifoliae]|uniref:uncharacterized protein LOC126905816 n=1 Tax=Daktulosphaira vitifoliae TaxID=58002 RepID=UPI0021AACC60|nr:uncharacterized protein LOC126905816 [Daktulosphaira vitifoliae]